MDQIQDLLVAGTHTADMLASAGWDIGKFFENLGEYIKEIGGWFLMAIGAAAVIWSGFLIIRKLFGGQSGQQDSWFKAIALLIVGGALMVGGFSVMDTFGKSGKATIDKLGGGAVVLQVDAPAEGPALTPPLLR